MKVLVVTNMYPSSEHPFYGIFVKEQVESLRKDGIAVDVFFINGRENRLHYFSSIIGLFKKLRHDHYDIIHAHHTYCVYPLLLIRMLMKTKVAFVLTFHEGEVYMTWKSIPRDVGFIKKCVCLKWLKKIAVKNVDLVISVEEKLTEKLDFKGKVVVLPCGVDLNLFRPRAKVQCREKLTLPLDKKVLFFPARPEAKGQKGFYIVQQALRFISRKDLNLVASRDIPHEDMPYYICAADVIVLASQCEASPMVIKEAMACNVPIVSTDVGDVKKVIGDTEGCYLCQRNAQDVAEKIEKALEFNTTTNGRDRILTLGLGLSHISRKIIEAYEGLISSFQEGNNN